MKYKDYYAALEVPRDADADAIRKAYRRLARKYHPDVSKESEAEARFKDIAEAYETLKDPEKRAAYDALGQRRAGEEFTAPGDWRDHFDFGDPGGGRFEDIDLADLLDALGRGRHARGGPRQAVPRRGQGGKGRNGGEAGDIYVHLRLQPDPHYRVAGKDLYFDLALSPWEAALGAEVHVPTLDGDVVLKVPAGAHSAQKLRLRGRGLGAATARGDLYAVVHIDVPRTLTERERELFGALAKDSRFNPRSSKEAQP